VASKNNVCWLSHQRCRHLLIDTPELPFNAKLAFRLIQNAEIVAENFAENFVDHAYIVLAPHAVAKAITGTHCNGFLFFHLTGDRA